MGAAGSNLKQAAKNNDRKRCLSILKKYPESVDDNGDSRVSCFNKNIILEILQYNTGTILLFTKIITVLYSILFRKEIQH